MRLALRPTGIAGPLRGRLSAMSDPIIATFSLVARDAATGNLGVAVASKFLAVGSIVPSAAAGVGAFASQARSNTDFGPTALRALGAGRAVHAIVAELQAGDDAIQQRQFGLVTATGESHSFTGNQCLPWAGGRAGPDFAAQGNILAGPEVLDALTDTWLRTDAPFPERLLAALAAADQAGGDSRGRQSASLYVVGHGLGYGGRSDRWIDLRVDDHPRPVTELARLLGVFQRPADEPVSAPEDLAAGMAPAPVSSTSR